MTPSHPQPILIDTGIDQGLPWHYGDPLKEQTHLKSSTSTVDLSNRNVLKITGVDSTQCLNLLGTTQLSDSVPGKVASTYFLNPYGHIISHLALVADPTEPVIWGWTEPNQGQLLVNYLNTQKRHLQVHAELSDLAVVWSKSNPGHHLYRHSTPNCLGGYELLIPKPQLSSIMSTGQPAGFWAYTAHRIAAGIPRFTIDTDDHTRPTELGSPTLKTPRQLVRLHFDGSQERWPEPKTALTPAENPNLIIGHLGSISYHHQLGLIGLGLINTNTDPSAILQANGVPATIEPLSSAPQR